MFILTSASVSHLGAFEHCGFLYCVCAWVDFLEAPLHLQHRCDVKRTSLNSFVAQKTCRFERRKQCSCVSLRICGRSFHRFDFDSTLGFPGEGPCDGAPWSLISANIGSIFSHAVWKSWADSVFCFQETRIGRNNVRNAKFEAVNVGKQLFPGELLPGVISTHGYKRTPHGGTAILGPPQTTMPFSFDDDTTGKYKTLFLTKRVVACWIQVLPKVRALVFSLYAQTGASSDSNIHDVNDNILQDMFQVACQFGDIPVIFAADLQDEPLTYSSVSNAIHFNQWIDPLLLLREDGSVSRDITFSNDRTFSGGSDGCSSIDAVLLNKVAATALKQAEILQTFNSQHRPIRVTFEWPTIQQVGHVLKKPASLCLDECTVTGNTAENIAVDIWSHTFASKFESTQDISQKWQVANDFCVETLLQCGAKWKNGPRERGQKPRFQTRKICPGQNPNGASATLLTSWQQNALRSLQEIRIRYARETCPGADFHDLQRTISRLRRRLEALQCPHVWLPWSVPDLSILQMCEIWLIASIRETNLKLKFCRIRKWREKIRESASSNTKYVFRHLKNKAKEEPANLVQDDEGNVVYDPIHALAVINDKWDDVFAANVCHDEPTKMLQTIWPYICNRSQTCEIPDLTGEHLRDVVCKRNPEASPGLDGWRTIEMQSLPVACFNPFAAIFRQIEKDDTELPSIMVCAKQLILNKNGSSDAMQERLITVLPILMLAYSGARFQQLQSWQIHFMPEELHGGIRGRRMASIPLELQLQLDEARQNNTSVLGLKLDKSKCFDRIIPSFAAALMLSFGVPKAIVRVFTKMYASLHRHLAYKSWIAPKPTHAPNGVAQGCSLSLVAINVYMAAWVFMARHLPNLYVRVFIDDSYLWSSLSNKSTLEKALQMTAVWDELSGQKMNISKCTAWGNDKQSRKAIKTMFPNMSHAVAFDVLGTLIVTDDKQHGHLSDAKINKIVLDTRNIAVLPLQIHRKTKLLGAKVLPQATFGALINVIPKHVTDRVTSAIANALWYGRPHWRSKFLVVGLLSKAHRVDVVLAKAYTTVLDFLRVLHLDPTMHGRCSNLFEHSASSNNNLMRHVIDAFNVFGISIDKQLRISFHGSMGIPLLELHVKDIKRLLAALAANVCYFRAQTRARKDFQKPSGILDLELTRSSWPKLQKCVVGSLPDSALLDAVQTGCLLTNDRLCAAGLVTSAQCRFCGFEKESTPHLVNDCVELHRQIGSPRCHEFGSNFAMMGIVEHPLGFIQQRLKWSKPTDIHIAPLVRSGVTLPLWTDGSVLGGHAFWITTGSFAIVDIQGSTIKAGPVFHWGLSSFTTELWAVLEAAAYADSWVHIFTDCKSVAERFKQLVQLSNIPPDWSHGSWWGFLLQLWIHKFNCNPDALQISWIPAHLCENMPIEMISEELAKDCKSSVIDIDCNRRADFAAKTSCELHAPLHISRYNDLPHLILEHHTWLVQLARQLDQEKETTNDSSAAEAPTQPNEDDEQHLRSFFHRWPWTTPRGSVRWSPPRPQIFEKPACWKNTDSDWTMFCNFLGTLQWDQDPSLSWSYFELACIFHLRGFTWENVNPAVFQIAALVPKVKKACIAIRKSAAHILLPGAHNPDKNRSIGKTLPSGTIDGVSLRCSSEELVRLGRFLYHGGNHRLSSWPFLLCDLF